MGITRQEILCVCWFLHHWVRLEVACSVKASCPGSPILVISLSPVREVLISESMFPPQSSLCPHSQNGSLCTLTPSHWVWALDKLSRVLGTSSEKCSYESLLLSRTETFLTILCQDTLRVLMNEMKVWVEMEPRCTWPLAGLMESYKVHINTLWGQDWKARIAVALLVVAFPIYMKKSIFNKDNHSKSQAKIPTFLSKGKQKRISFQLMSGWE